MDRRARYTAEATEAVTDEQLYGPHRLSQQTLRDYKIEWSRYTEFAKQFSPEVPGLDKTWDLSLLWSYVQRRSQTCKPTTITQIITKLRHFGLRHGYVLANSKFDAKPVEYGKIRNMKKQVALDAHTKSARQGKKYVAVERCTPVGKRGVDMLLSAFTITTEARFRRLRREDRHQIVTSVMQHTGGMCFGQFTERDYTLGAFISDAADNSLRLVTDYSRYSGRRQYWIEFEAFPRYECMWYHVRSEDGTIRCTLTAAMIMQWHFKVLREQGERHIFRPAKDIGTTRDQRQKWLRRVLWRALPMRERKARTLIADVTPHSFRAGLAGDLLHEGVSLQIIGSVCRWNSMIDVRLYAERPCMSMSRTTEQFRLIPYRG